MWFAVGLLITMSSPGLNLGTLSAPESGFMPFLTGLVICVFSIVSFIQALLDQKTGEERVWAWVRWQTPLAVTIILVAYIFLIKPVGYLICTFVLILTLTRFVASEGWGSSILSSVLGSSLSYILFNIFLKAYLPKGILG